MAVRSNPLSINPGELRNKITIETPAHGRSASGSVSNTWSVFATVRAKIEPMGGTEKAGADSFWPEATHRITIRYVPGMDSSMRVNFNGRFFDIQNVNNILERGRKVELICREGLSHGNA